MKADRHTPVALLFAALGKEHADRDDHEMNSMM